MKKYLYILVALFICSCEDVIDVDLNTIEPKLVIDASINWFKDSPGNEQEIKLTLTAPYFANEIQPASGAQVTVSKAGDDIFVFTEDSNTGIYKNNAFIPQINETYSLEIRYQDQIYSATETLKSVVDIDFVEQNDEGGFSGDETELKAFYTDPINEENYYFFEFLNDIPDIPTLEVYDDNFTNGNQIFGFYTEEELEAGDLVTIRNYGVSERFYEFMFILLQQNAQEGGGPFETQPATVRGNCINETNPKNFPLGYFRLSEVAELIYTVE
ncbi:MAG: hypothetical protein ACJAZK_002357 [Psychroserpens sp.]|jgi:hypothetical protein|uniref:DUF4249 domain-containing protein n=1 Tax=Psychroserpens sp. TaxID=2020870 RepID=UPI0039E6B13C